ncbi:type II secretion system protein GspM [Pelovirga terrestris]|uniref:Type 4a pilus biogenesis protein PilO n=1 Tax=Pelovirga terrestris TaxID=2771352 RepID=A0A8J6QV94_9BACT|nr:type II secretion system protein GspM [Pelovirga terrestris]MBD1401420.1 type 4a pilus biogenesis protein PilO [Pelovirga terrestris]
MARQWTLLVQWFDQRALRERAVLLLCAVAVMVAAVYLLVLAPATQKRTLAGQQIERMTAEIGQLEMTETLIMARSQVDPDQELRERHDHLVEQLAEQRRQLHQGVSHLVTPAEMPELLKQMLTQGDLHLISLENLPAERISFGKDSSDQTLRLYRHSVQMELRGDYLGLLAYLRQLDQLPRLLVWEEVAVATKEYPTTTIRLRVYTLGLSEEWLGG